MISKLHALLWIASSNLGFALTSQLGSTRLVLPSLNESISQLPQNRTNSIAQWPPGRVNLDSQLDDNMSYSIQAGKSFAIDQMPGTIILADYIDLITEFSTWKRRQDLMPDQWTYTRGSVKVTLHDDRIRLTKMRLLNVLWDLHLLIERFEAVADLDIGIIIVDDDLRIAFLDVRIDAPKEA